MKNLRKAAKGRPCQVRFPLVVTEGEFWFAHVFALTVFILLGWAFDNADVMAVAIVMVMGICAGRYLWGRP